MLFKITELKDFLLSIHKQKIESIVIQSKGLKLSVNTMTQKKRYLSSNKAKPPLFDKKKIKKGDEISLTNQAKVGSEHSLYFTIISPMIGTFYRSPAPNEAPFVRINDSVKANQTVCIIEAMKLMNEIESEVNGDIIEILVEDGDIVDCGQALMRVKEKN